jgi:hypothetical protein
MLLDAVKGAVQLLHVPIDNVVPIHGHADLPGHLGNGVLVEGEDAIDKFLFALRKRGESGRRGGCEVARRGRGCR